MLQPRFEDNPAPVERRGEERNRWVAPARNAPGARVNVFCFPFAGGGASLFRAWAPVVPPSIALCPVQLPAREERMGETPFDRMQALVTAAADAIEPLTHEKPYALFGHSMGAAIAYELAHAFRERGAPAPVHLFPSGAPAPHYAAQVRPVFHLPEPEFLEAVKDFGGLPDEVLRSPELLRLLMPRMRADLSVTGTYTHTERPPLTCPITAFGATDDHVVPVAHLEAWRGYTVAAFRAHWFTGGHFFLLRAARELVSAMAAELP